MSRPTLFDDLPPTPESHLRLHVEAALYRLVRHLRRLGEPPATGEPLAQRLARLPWLAAGFDQLVARMPEGVSWREGAGWWRHEVAVWETRAAQPLPLSALGFEARLALVLAGLPEEDSRWGDLFAELLGASTLRRPSLELLAAVLAEPDGAARGEIEDLLASGVLVPESRETPRAEQTLRVPELLWRAAAGRLGERPAPGARLLEDFPALEQLVLAADTRARLLRVPELLAGAHRVLVLRGAPGGDPLAVMGAVARRLGRRLLVLEGGEETAKLAGPLARLTGAMPCCVYDLAPGETAALPALAGYSGPVGVCLGLEGGLGTLEGMLTLDLPAPDAALRARLWRSALGPAVGADLERIAEELAVGAGTLRRLAAGALAEARLGGRGVVSLADVRAAGRTLGREQLDSLASPLAADETWEQLIVGAGTQARLAELVARCRHRERLPARLGPGFGRAGQRGVRALFTGPSGTGKTLAARVVAAELGMDLYRVDLAAIVNKYIGETEKNLHRVLARAEALDVVLLLDEGDTLLGNRTEVRSANDRYANLETNYLLQRLESYQGIVLVTTNLGDNIDPAFQRRMDVVVPFFAPSAEERLAILGLHLPLDHGVEPDFLDRVARRCALSGGQLRNTAATATLLALGAGRRVGRDHLAAALAGEYRKAGAIYPLEERHAARRAPRAGLPAFLAALSES